MKTLLFVIIGLIILIFGFRFIVSIICFVVALVFVIFVALIIWAIYIFNKDDTPEQSDEQ